MLVVFLENENLFGGIPVILEGDFIQIVPDIYKRTWATIVQANIQYSFIWPQFQKHFLHQNMQIYRNLANKYFGK